MKKVNLVVKRIIDIIGSFVGLLLLLPLLIVLAFVIKLDSNGPILFKQERLGLEGKSFWIYKFRTMIVNAELIGDGLSIKSDNDNRITKVGSIMRRTSLDELPQLINVFIGNMSLVGPRPPVTYYPYEGYSNYPEWAKPRFSMKPGVTGLAQVMVRNSVSWDERINVDLSYIEKFNVFLDFKILIMTVKRVFSSKNIYE